MRARASTVIASLSKSPTLSSNPNSLSQLSTPPTAPTFDPTFVRATDAKAALRPGAMLLFRYSLEVKSTVSATDPVSPGICIESSLREKFIIEALEEGYISGARLTSTTAVLN